MQAGEVKRLVKEWLEGSLNEHEGLVAAHFVGGITALPDDAPFPPYKDVDMHLIFEDGSAALAPRGPFGNILETGYKGVMIEGGLKPASDYRSAVAVLANPEIAHHMTLDSIIYDPLRLLSGLQEEVKREYPRRTWVLARAQYEKNGLGQVFGMMDEIETQYGAAGVINLIGYGATYISALLGVVTLGPPAVGSHMLANIERILARYGRDEMYSRLLRVLGVDRIGQERAAELLEEGIEAFDLAVRIKKTPIPFEHKLHAHMRPYFVESSRAMMEEGNYRHATAWLQPYYSATFGVIMADGADELKPKYAQRFRRFVQDLGMETHEQRAERIAQARALYSEITTLADEIIMSNPAIIE
jgi:hypothetical protein